MKRITFFCILTALGLAAYLYNAEDKPDDLSCSKCNIVVITIDTLRADHLPFYGYFQNTSPFLNELADKSTVFERAFSTSSWTAPASASFFTSVLPSRHGVITGFAITKKMQRKGKKMLLNKIPAGLQTLGEFAAAHGYTTIGVADNINIGKEIGFDRGFSKFKKYSYQGAPAVNRQAHEFLKEVPKDKPYFLYLHYMDPHEPFHTRQPWHRECMKTINRSGKNNILCAYNSEIRYTDERIKELFSEYRWFENSIVIVLADHGEEFWDHGKQGHGTSLYTELIRVPFIIYHPKLRAQRVSQNVSTLDLLPTISGLLGSSQDTVWEGRNLAPLMLGEKSNNKREIISERLRHPEGGKNWSKRSIVVEDRHYIRTDLTRPSEKKQPEKELFDLENDFAESNNIAASEPETAANLSEKLQSISDLGQKSGSSDIAEMEIEPELVKDLKTLGYID